MKKKCEWEKKRKKQRRGKIDGWRTIPELLMESKHHHIPEADESVSDRKT
jgi:hypothetical protein